VRSKEEANAIADALLNVAALVRPSLAVGLILATSFGTLGVARLQDVRTRKALQLMQRADRTSR
jgi:hypothetical protein